MSVFRRYLSEACIKQGQKSCKSRFIIIDVQIVKNTDRVQSKGYDAGKKISGIKRHITVNTQELPHALAITAIDSTDRSDVLLAFEQNTEALTEVKGVLCDGGYSGKPFADAVKRLLGEQVDVQAVKCNELHTFTVISQQWVVERSFSWLEKQRRFWKTANENIILHCNL